MSNKKRRNTPSTSASVVFTEDGVLVQTLFLQHISQSITQENIKAYFSAFGAVTSVKIVQRKQCKDKQQASSGNRYGFVTFVKPEAAAKALNEKNHKISNKPLKVKMADKWQQPNTQKPTVNGKLKGPHCNRGGSKQSGTTILDLNDDCLLHLFTYLTPIEKLRISLICLRFRYIIESLVKDDVFDFNNMKTFTLMETVQILSRFRSVIKRIRLAVSDASEQNIDFIQNCHNLEELVFDSDLCIDFRTYRRLFSSLKKIKVLKFKNCYIDNKICLLIAGQAGLKSLTLPRNLEITGEHLHKLTNLEELNLAYCENVEPRDFINICEANQLKKLNIAGCHLLTDDAFNILVRSQKELEQIIISTSYKANCIGIISNLMNLKHIQIHRAETSYFGTDILKEIAQNRREQLESLEIYNLLVTTEPGNREKILQFCNLKKLCLFHDKYLDDDYLITIANNCTQLVDLNIGGTISVTADAVLTVVSTLKQLKHLNISFCSQFYDTLCNQIFKVKLEKNAVPLTLYVYKTNIKESFLKTKKYKQCKKLLTLDFTADFYFRIIDSIRDVDLDDSFEYFNEDSDVSDSDNECFNDWFQGEDFDDYSYPDGPFAFY